MTKNKWKVMDKRGAILELVGIIVIIVISIYGVSTVYYQKNDLYVGYGEFAYKYAICKDFIEELPQEGLVLFKSYEEIPKEYQIGACNGN